MHWLFLLLALACLFGAWALSGWLVPLLLVAALVLFIAWLRARPPAVAPTNRASWGPTSCAACASSRKRARPPRPANTARRTESARLAAAALAGARRRRRGAASRRRIAPGLVPGASGR